LRLRGQIDHGVRDKSRNRKLGGPGRDNPILESETPRACNMSLAVAVGSAQSNAQALDLAPAVVDQMQPRAAGVGRQPADHDFSPVDAQRPLVVGKLTPDLE